MTENNNLSDVNDNNNPSWVKGDNVLEGDTSVVPEGGPVVPGGSQTNNKKVKLRNIRTKSTDELPKDYIDKVVREYYNDDSKVTTSPRRVLMSRSLWM